MSAAPIDPHASDFVTAPSAAIPEAGRAGKNARRNAEIVAKRKAGMWPRQIAKEMGLSHNAVIGVCNRAGLSGPAGHAERARGDACGGSKLRETDISIIRAIYEPYDRDLGAPALAQCFGVGVAAIYDIVHRRTWTHVEQAT